MNVPAEWVLGFFATISAAIGLVWRYMTGYLERKEEAAREREAEHLADIKARDTERKEEITRLQEK